MPEFIPGFLCPVCGYWREKEKDYNDIGGWCPKCHKDFMQREAHERPTYEELANELARVKESGQ